MNSTSFLDRVLRRRRMLVAALVLAGAIAPAALAHTDISSTTPGRGATAKTTITKVSITFSGMIRRGSIRVVGPGQTVVSVGPSGRDPRNTKRALVALKSKLKPGSYKVIWRIVAGDGHFQNGAFSFKLVRP